MAHSEHHPPPHEDDDRRDAAVLADNPDWIHTKLEFGAALTHLQTLSGLSRSQLRTQALSVVRRFRQENPRSPVKTSGFSDSAMSGWFNGSHLPSADDLRFLLDVLDARRASARKAWLDKRTEVQQEPLGRPITRWKNPIDLGVHPPITTPSHNQPGHGARSSLASAPLPTYITRRHDTQLRDLLTDAGKTDGEGGSLLIVVVGGSSTGKTRACYEAVAAALPNWALTYPRTGSELLHLLADPLPPRTVVWLTELQRYLDQPNVPETLHRHLNDPTRSTNPVVFLGSMWPTYWRTYLNPPPDPAVDRSRSIPARDLLQATRTHRITATPDFTDPDDWDRLLQAAKYDPVLTLAIGAAGPDRAVTQTIAGGPQLRQRYLDRLTNTDDDNPATQADRAAAAITRAAIDLTRAGHPAPHPTQLLKKAAAGYLTGTDQVQPRGWANQALATLTTPDRGIATLTELRLAPGPGRADHHHLHDYLTQWGTTHHRHHPIPQTTWDALLTADLTEDIAYNALTALLNRGMYHHAQELATEVDANVSSNWVWVGYENDERALRALASAEIVWATQRLAELLAERDGNQGLHASAALGDSKGPDLLADERELRDLYFARTNWTRPRLVKVNGRDDEQGVRSLAGAGNTWAAMWLAEMLAERGDEQGLRNLAATGNTWATEGLADMLAKRRDEQGIRDLFADDDIWAAQRLAEMVAERNDEQGLRDLASKGNVRAAQRLAEMLGERNDEQGLRDLYANGNAWAGNPLSEMHFDRSDEQGLRDLYSDDNLWAAQRLAEMLRERNDEQGLRDLYATDNFEPSKRLVEMLAGRDDEQGLRNLAAGTNSWLARKRLTELVAERGDEQSLRELHAAGNHWSSLRLAELFVEKGDEQGLRDLHEEGNYWVAGLLAKVLFNQGDEQGLRDLSCGGTLRAASNLAILLWKRGDLAGLIGERNAAISATAAHAVLDLLGHKPDSGASLDAYGTTAILAGSRPTNHQSPWPASPKADQTTSPTSSPPAGSPGA